jgi:hypothetical protein
MHHRSVVAAAVTTGKASALDAAARVADSAAAHTMSVNLHDSMMGAYEAGAYTRPLLSST